MKKIIGSALIAGALATGAMAAGTGYIKVGANSSKADTGTKPSTTAYEIGFGGYNHLFTENFIVGSEANYGQQSYDFSSGTTNDMMTFGGELHLGWTFMDSLDTYGIIGYYGTKMDYTFADGTTDTLTGGGVRYGIGVDYIIWKHLSVGVRYNTTKYDLTDSVGADLGKVKFTNIGGNIKFRF